MRSLMTRSVLIVSLLGAGLSVADAASMSAESRSALEREASERNVRVTLDDGAVWKGEDLRLGGEGDDLRLAVPGDDASSDRAVPLNRVTALSVRNRDRGALLGLLAGLGTGLVLAPLLATDTRGDYFYTNGAIAVAVLLTGGTVGFVIGARSWGWTTHRPDSEGNW